MYSPTQHAGKANYMAPEIVNNLGQDVAVDIWSFGCILIELLTTLPPYYSKAANTTEIYEQIKLGPPSVPAKASIVLKDLISKCLTYDKTKRPRLDR